MWLYWVWLVKPYLVGELSLILWHQWVQHSVSIAAASFALKIKWNYWGWQHLGGYNEVKQRAEHGRTKAGDARTSLCSSLGIFGVMAFILGTWKKLRDPAFSFSRASASQPLAAVLLFLFHGMSSNVWCMAITPRVGVPGESWQHSSDQQRLSVIFR